VRLLKSRDCIGRKCGVRFGVPRASQQISREAPSPLCR
jgi:hypothetical protein